MSFCFKEVSGPFWILFARSLLWEWRRFCRSESYRQVELASFLIRIEVALTLSITNLAR